MGVGKTTVGNQLANKMYRNFMDVDQELEKLYQMSVSQMFKEMGEANFRKLEKDFIVDLCENSRMKIISLGGGAFMQEEIRKACLSTSIVFFLDLSWDKWKDRIHLIMDSRPILQQKSLEEIEDLFYSRMKAYSLNNSTISTDDLNPEEVADFILQTLKLGFEIYQPEYWR